MNYKLLVLTIIVFTSILKGQNVIIPDAKFKAALITDGVDTNSDGEIQITEAKAVSSIGFIGINSKSIKSLQGIEAFTSLTDLNCNSNLLTSLDVSKNTELTYLNCASNMITHLDLSNNKLLKILYCHFNSLSDLDISKNSLIEEFWCTSNPQLTNICITSTQLDLSKSNPDFWKKDASTSWNLNCSTITSLDIDNPTLKNKEVIRILTTMGQEITKEFAIEGVFIYQYSDGTTSKIVKQHF